MDSQVEEVKAKTDIVELIGQTVKLTKAGRNYKGLCPFHHEKSPSFIVSPERGTWRCFGCGEHGDAITFLEKYENLSFVEALQQLAQKAGVELKRQKQDPQRQQQQQRLYQLLQLAADYYHYLLTQHPSGKVAKEYIDSRGIDDKTVQTFYLGYAPDSWQSVSKFLQQKGFTPSEIARVGISSQNDAGREYDRFRGRLMFPISDSVGRIVGFSGRSLSNNQDVAKYLNSPDTDLFHKGRLLFGLQQAKQGIRNNQRIVLVEGNVDLLSSHQAGVTEVVAPLGTALTEDQVLLIKKFTQNVYLAYDQDKAGQAAIWRGLPLMQAQQLNVKVINLPAGQDPDQFIQANPQGWAKAIDSAQEVFIYLLGSLGGDFNLSSAQGKQQAVQKVIPFIASTPDSVAQAFLLHQAADVIGVEEQLLKTRVERWRPEQIEDRSQIGEAGDNPPSTIHHPPNKLANRS